MRLFELSLQTAGLSCHCYRENGDYATIDDWCDLLPYSFCWRQRCVCWLQGGVAGCGDWKEPNLELIVARNIWNRILMLRKTVYPCVLPRRGASFDNEYSWGHSLVDNRHLKETIMFYEAYTHSYYDIDLWLHYMLCIWHTLFLTSCLLFCLIVWNGHATMHRRLFSPYSKATYFL